MEKNELTQADLVNKEKLVAPHIKKLPAVMKLIIQKKGGPTGK